MSRPAAVRTYDADLFTDEALTDPYVHYQTLRDLGPVVWLEAHGVYAVARYEDVRAILADPETFCSGQGVGLNDVLNELGRGTTLMSDGDDHRRLREVIGRPLTPKALTELRPLARVRATELAEQLVERGVLDAVPDLAEVLPTTWIPDLLGWPVEGREKLLDWARPPSTGSDHPTIGRTQRRREFSRWRRSPHSWPPVNFRRGRWQPAFSMPSPVVTSARISVRWRSSITWARPWTRRSVV